MIQIYNSSEILITVGSSWFYTKSILVDLYTTQYLLCSNIGGNTWTNQTVPHKLVHKSWICTLQYPGYILILLHYLLLYITLDYRSIFLLFISKPIGPYSYLFQYIITILIYITYYIFIYI